MAGPLPLSSKPPEANAWWLLGSFRLPEPSKLGKSEALVVFVKREVHPRDLARRCCDTPALGAGASAGALLDGAGDRRGRPGEVLGCRAAAGGGCKEASDVVAEETYSVTLSRACAGTWRVVRDANQHYAPSLTLQCCSGTKDTDHQCVPSLNLPAWWRSALCLCLGFSRQEPAMSHHLSSGCFWCTSQSNCQTVPNS